MAKNVRQRRRRDILIGVLAMGIILVALLGKTVVQAIVIPDMPGYAKEAPVGYYAQLPWKMLEQGDWEENQAPVVPSAIRAQDGKPVTVRGFLLPLHVPGVSSEFFIAEKPMGCPFCNPPGVAQVVHIKVAGGKKMSPTDWPVKVYGKFHVAANEKLDDMLYTINDATLVITH